MNRINFLAVFSLIAVALIMMYKQDLGITGTEAKIGLKTLHVTLGYVFAINLLVHLFFVVRVEVTEGGGIISAMFTGNKATDKTPVDS